MTCNIFCSCCGKPLHQHGAQPMPGYWPIWQTPMVPTWQNPYQTTWGGGIHGLLTGGAGGAMSVTASGMLMN